MKKQKAIFEPVPMADEGRRAQRRGFLETGLVVEATAASVAGHAMANVLEALQLTQRCPQAFKDWAVQLRRFPDLPNADCSTQERTIGRVEVDVNEYGVGYGCLNPAGAKYAFGRAVFNRPTHAEDRIAEKSFFRVDKEVNH
jgi:hypothetical protein